MRYRSLRLPSFAVFLAVILLTMILSRLEENKKVIAAVNPSAAQSVPVLMLTARDDVTDKVLGLDCGADDYMTKPFSPEELLARIRALSRRQGDVLLEDIHWADLTLKLSSRTLHCGAKSVSLGFKEFEVLKLLLANPNGIVSKEELLVKVWGSDSNAEDNNVEAYISFLRKKFFYLGSHAGIGTVRKVGYHLEEQI